MVENDNSMVSKPKKAGKQQRFLTLITKNGNIGKPQNQGMLPTTQSRGAREPLLQHPPGLLNINSVVKV